MLTKEKEKKNSRASVKSKVDTPFEHMKVKMIVKITCILILRNWIICYHFRIG